MKSFLIHLYFFALSITAFPETIRVCEECKFSSIKSAIAKAQPGDTVLILPGTYKEGTILIEKPIIILGLGFPVIDGEDKNEIFTVKASGVTLSGLLLKHSGKSSLNDLAAIKLLNASRVTISGNRLEDNYFGIYLSNCTDCRIENNKIQGEGDSQQGSGNGIHLWKCSNIQIKGNESRGHRDGIYFEFVTGSSIINNISEQNLRYGLHFMFSDNDSYEQNTFRANGAGVAVMYTKNVRMKANTFELNWGSGAYGLLLKDIRDSEITSNTFVGNTTAIYAESASRIRISKNSFVRNGWALRITSSCDELQITNNNFIGNTYDMAAATSNNITVNTFDGNYWDKYDGYDLNRDQKGDIPYYPVSLSAMLVEKIPAASYFLHSFVLNLINQSEKMFPNLIPSGIKDTAPLMKKQKL